MAEQEGRHYMNKMFGQKLDEARDLDGKRRKHRAVGSVRRVTVEPDDDGKGHHVTVERVTAVALPHGSPDEGIEKRSFGSHHEALQFLRGVLGGEPEGHEEEGEPEPRRRRGPENEEPASEEEPGASEEEEPEEGKHGGGGLLARMLSGGMHER